jgi:hypothetical protein
VRQDDPCHYDVSVNTDHLPLEEAAHVVVDLFRRRFP